MDGRVQNRMGVVTQNGELFPSDIYSNIVIIAPKFTAKALLNIRKPMIPYGFKLFLLSK